MPRYFFHLCEKLERILDWEGLELVDDETAVREASQAVRELLGEDEMPANWKGWSFHVVDETGRLVVAINLDESSLH